MVWDITKDPVIDILDENNKPTGEKKVVEPWVIEYAQKGMRAVVEYGTAAPATALGFYDVPSAGKTGSAEYCDNVAQEKNLCQPEAWPSHAWYVGYAPYDDPEIVIIAFVYNGTEGAAVAAPIVGKVMEAYFELKAIDSAGKRRLKKSFHITVGDMFNRELWKHFDFWLFGAVVFLSLFGILMIQSAIAGNTELAGFVKRQAIYLGIGLGGTSGGSPD